jgi:26S proteasome regulatory subunit N3
VIDAQIDHEH